MAKLINKWEDLIGLESKYYKVELNFDYGDGHIVPKKETEETLSDYWRHHRYLNTYMFDGTAPKDYTALFQQYGFDVEINNKNKKEGN